MEVRVVPSDPAWVEIYEAEARLIRAALNELDVEVHHIGSTAIHGIFAKPIIDILLVVRDLSSLDSQTAELRALGYESMGEFGIPARRYFRKTSQNGNRTHQIHAFERSSSGAKRHLAFRDYMNAHAEAAEAYSLLKQRLANEFPFDIQAYIDGKDAFIKQHESMAFAWAFSNQNPTWLLRSTRRRGQPINLNAQLDKPDTLPLKCISCSPQSTHPLFFRAPASCRYARYRY